VAAPQDRADPLPTTVLSPLVHLPTPRGSEGPSDMQPMQGFSTPVHAPVTVATPASGEAEVVDLVAEPGPDGHGNVPVASSDQDAVVAAAELSALIS
jgi:hypothetical protein